MTLSSLIAVRLIPVGQMTAAALLFSSIIIGGTGCASTDTSNYFTYAKAANREGMTLYQEGDYIDASAAFNNAVRQNPRDYNSFFYLGASYQQLGSYQQSISAYRSCLDVMQLSVTGEQDVAMRFKTMDTLAQVIAKSATSGVEIAALEKKCEGKPSVDDQWMLAKTLRYSGDADAAVEAYNKAVLIDPTRFEITKEAGLYEAVLGQNDRAAQTLKKAYVVKSDDDQVNDALHRLGVVIGPNTRDLTLIHM